MSIKSLLTKRNLSRMLPAAVAAIFLLVPLATPLSVFLGSQLGSPEAFKAWKEIIILLLAVIAMIAGMYKRFGGIKERGVRILLWLIVAYAAWTLLTGLLSLTAFERVNTEALAFALLVNLRFLFFFILCWLIAGSSSLLKANWQKLLLVPAGIVVAFGLLQAFALPSNILEHAGYGPDTIPAYQTVDQNPDYTRVQSTQRGPNPLGVYLILIIAGALAMAYKKRWPQIILLAGSAIVLFYTYSRSAWLGAAVAIAALAYISITNLRIRRYLAIGGLAAALILAGAVYIGRDNQFIQKTVFHSDETSLSPQSSNEQRAGALQSGLGDLYSEPLGRGPGTAGPASVHNKEDARIAENYYLQIGQETGWIGLALFLAINVLIALLLWARRNQPLAKVLLASLAGIAAVGLVSHAWTDDTIALVWWGLAGIALAPLPVAKTKS